jgi:hypothetical protein
MGIYYRAGLRAYVPKIEPTPRQKTQKQYKCTKSKHRTKKKQPTTGLKEQDKH